MTDMRAHRTRQHLRTALLEIMREVPYQGVTVRMVTQRAQVSKNSFYNHYADLAELAQDCYMQESIFSRKPQKFLYDYEHIADACLDALNERAHTLVFFKNNPNLARVILDNVCTSPYFAECYQIEEDLTVEHLKTMYGDERSPLTSYRRTARYIVNGASALLRAWFIDGMREPIEDVVKDVYLLAFHSTAGAVGRSIEPAFLDTIGTWHFAEGAQA